MNKINVAASVFLSLSCLNACVIAPNTRQTSTAAVQAERNTSEWQQVYPNSEDAGDQEALSSSDHIVKREESKSVDELRIGKIHLEKKGFESFKGKAEKNIFMQKYDYSCGAASLATLMHYYFGDSVSERSLLEYIKRFYTPDEYKRIEDEGLSFLELEQISQSLGYQTASVRLKMESLKKLRGPVVVFVARDDYRHFAILKGIFEDRVFIADPSRGNIRMSFEEFAEEWDGRTFILGKKGHDTAAENPMSIDEMPPLRKEIIMLRTLLKRQQPIVQDSHLRDRMSQRILRGG